MNCVPFEPIRSVKLSKLSREFSKTELRSNAGCTQAILTEEDDNLKDGENPLSRKQLTYTNNYKYYLLESNYLEWKNAPHAGYKCLIWIHLTEAERIKNI